MQLALLSRQLADVEKKKKIGNFINADAKQAKAGNYLNLCRHTEDF